MMTPVDSAFRLEHGVVSHKLYEGARPKKEARWLAEVVLTVRTTAAVV